MHNFAKLTEQGEKVITTHKEERQARVISEQLQKFVSTCIHPFDTSVKELCNIYSGETCSEKTNVNKSYEIGTELMLEFQRGLPEGFHSRLPTRVISMVKGKRAKKKDEIVEMYKNESIFSRVLYLLSANQIDLGVFNYKVAPFPTSIFEDSGSPGSQNRHQF